MLHLPAAKPSRYGLVYLFLAAALPVLALFNTKAIVPLTIVAALALFVIAARDGKLDVIKRLDRFLWLGLAGYLSIFLVSSILGDTWITGAVSLGKLLGLTLIAIIVIPLQARLSATDLKWIACALIGAILFALCWVAIYILHDIALYTGSAHSAAMIEDHLNRISYYGYFWFKPAATVTLILSLIAGIYLHRTGHRVAAILLAVCSAGLCYWVGNRTAFYGSMLAMGVGVFYHFMGRHRLKLIVFILAIAFAIPPVMNLLGFSPGHISSHLSKASPGSNSIVYRLHIWEFVADKITEKPLLGWGAGASKRLGTDAVDTLTDPKFGTLGEPIPVHPHNGILQVWLEFGFFGALFVFILIARGMAIADRYLTEPWQRIWVSASATLLACFFGFSFSISSSWWLATVIVCIAIAAAFVAIQSQSPAPTTPEESAPR
ncbi:MAG: O-antigen ligase family protein [Rhodospirillales bacterium]